MHRGLTVGQARSADPGSAGDVASGRYRHLRQVRDRYLVGTLADRDRQGARHRTCERDLAVDGRCDRGPGIGRQVDSPVPGVGSDGRKRRHLLPRNRRQQADQTNRQPHPQTSRDGLVDQAAPLSRPTYRNTIDG